MKKISLLIALFLFVCNISGQTNSVESRVESILQKMTLEEKNDALGGINGFDVRGFEHLYIPQ